MDNTSLVIKIYPVDFNYKLSFFSSKGFMRRERTIYDRANIFCTEEVLFLLSGYDFLLFNKL